MLLEAFKYFMIGTLFTVAIDLIVQHIQELLRPSANKIGNKRPRYNSDSFVGRPH